VTAGGECVPRLARGHRLREDKVRGRWVILAPERLFEPDEIALEVLRLVDGISTFDAIVDTLAARFNAPREAIAADVATMLAELQERQVIAP
jgi:pyrroloquinoline quinone biosynthesis protein D